MPDSIDYGKLMHKAMRSLIQDVLNGIAADGLPGDHHFFITFDTGHPDAEIADWLSDRYPGDMTVVMQHWFQDLVVADDGFAVTLNFGDAPERLFVPYDAIKTFVDPSVEFGLRFESQDDEDDMPEAISPDNTPLRDLSKGSDSESDDDGTPKDADVVSLDSFRK